MRGVFPRSARSVPVFSQAGFFLSGIPAGGAEEKAGREGKIKETGTTLAGFLKLLLSAHWLGEPLPAPCFWTARAAISRKVLALLGFDRHHGRRTPDFPRFWPEARP
ncbi:hypothetical protein [Paracoccus aerodenitrificans]|uniref:hypothetical protein n=1 Tax=Paracoccus aerodenitrificans TaxID=3017781 RepID=UPI0022F0A47F|nr:hypothetical protein [Paracoccus aerodenitrificans]WBU65587.1 hypothetical protein PAE61_09295 [Paracoccus aerodenitrificans]